MERHTQDASRIYLPTYTHWSSPQRSRPIQYSTINYPQDSLLYIRIRGSTTTETEPYWRTPSSLLIASRPTSPITPPEFLVEAHPISQLQESTPLILLCDEILYDEDEDEDEEEDALQLDTPSP